MAAAHFASLHVPGNPLVIPNIWDLSSLNTILSLNSPSSPSSPTNPTPSIKVKAVATASYAIAATLGLSDAQLSLGANLIRISQLAPRVRASGLPLTVDIQDGYRARLEEVVRAVVGAGAVGANIEDLRESVHGEEDGLWSLEEQNGCPGFVVNARCDVLSLAFKKSGGSGQSSTAGKGKGSSDGHGDSDVGVGVREQEEEGLMREVIRRGKAYLAAGATTVFVWGGPGRGLRDAEIRTLVAAFGGRLAVKLGSGEDALSVRELADMGVARISVGPSLYIAGNKTIQDEAERIIEGGRLS
ncbi:phosphoenolpyruvate phosphomutase-domain-containing protein [Xylaria arbuscula]|nr:phosphoenolpyruvate phosphomutase-domain-containing protein [Xylaria arbuscula]